METRDPSAPGFGLPLDSGRPDHPILVLHPRAAAWLWIIPISFCGLVLSGCNLIVLLTPGQGTNGSSINWVAFLLLGLAILAAPLLRYFNSEVRFSDGVVTKRGILRKVRRWEQGQLVRIHCYIRYVSGLDGDFEMLNHVVYRFLLSSGETAFSLTQAWWRTTDIEALARALMLQIPAPSDT